MISSSWYFEVLVGCRQGDYHLHVLSEQILTSLKEELCISESLLCLVEERVVLLIAMWEYENFG